MRYAALFILTLALSVTSWAQWSSNPAVNLPIADNNNGSDQVQPKIVTYSKDGAYKLVRFESAEPTTAWLFGFLSGPE